MTDKDQKPTNKQQAKPDGEKLQKALARLGLGSRRGLEKVISEGRITVNGEVATLGARVGQGDEIRIDGRKVRYTPDELKTRRVILYHKPEGEICSAKDPEGRPTVFERLPKISHDRWVMVGRLDINSAGLLLFTNDGELANRLMHPSHEVEREYAVRVLGDVTNEHIRTLQAGVELEDDNGTYTGKFTHVRLAGGDGANKWYNVTLKEGRNREVRRMFASQDLTVSRLIRIRYGDIKLPSHLKNGRWIELENRDIDSLLKRVDLAAYSISKTKMLRKQGGSKQDKYEKRRDDKKVRKGMSKDRVRRLRDRKR